MRRTTAVLLVGLLLTACARTTGTSATRRPASEPCPATSAAGALEVPAAPSADTVGRLVPADPPVEALLCRYVPDGAGTAPLDGQVALVAGLERVPQDLLLPGGTPPCDEPADADAHLLRLTYGEGIVWVAAAGPCAGTTNGRFASGEDRSDVLAASFAASAWTVPPQPEADQRCVPERTGRAGQEFALLPGGSTSLVLCRVAGDGVTRWTASEAQRAAVQRALDAPVATREPQPCPAAPEQYELVARYPSGPAVRVAYLPGCALDVGNGSLQAALEPDGAAAVRRVVEQAFG